MGSSSSMRRPEVTLGEYARNTVQTHIVENIKNVAELAFREENVVQTSMCAFCVLFFLVVVVKTLSPRKASEKDTVLKLQSEESGAGIFENAIKENLDEKSVNHEELNETSDADFSANKEDSDFELDEIQDNEFDAQEFKDFENEESVEELDEDADVEVEKIAEDENKDVKLQDDVSKNLQIEEIIESNECEILEILESNIDFFEQNTVLETSEVKTETEEKQKLVQDDFENEEPETLLSDSTPNEYEITAIKTEDIVCVETEEVTEGEVEAGDQVEEQSEKLEKKETQEPSFAAEGEQKKSENEASEKPSEFYVETKSVSQSEQKDMWNERVTRLMQATSNLVSDEAEISEPEPETSFAVGDEFEHQPVAEEKEGFFSGIFSLFGESSDEAEIDAVQKDEIFEDKETEVKTENTSEMKDGKADEFLPDMESKKAEDAEILKQESKSDNGSSNDNNAKKMVSLLDEVTQKLQNLKKRKAMKKRRKKQRKNKSKQH